MTERKLITPVFRVSYAWVFKPQPNQDGDKKVYSVTGIFNEEEMKADAEEWAKWQAMRQFAADLFKAKWPNQKGFGGFKMPFRPDSDFDLVKNPAYEGNIMVAMRSYDRIVGILDVDKTPIVNDPEAFYSGCYARASIGGWAYDNKGKGVSFSLRSLMKVRDGEPLVARSNPDEDFAEIPAAKQDNSAELNDDDPLAGLN